MFLVKKTFNYYDNFHKVEILRHTSGKLHYIQFAHTKTITATQEDGNLIHGKEGLLIFVYLFQIKKK